MYACMQQHQLLFIAALEGNICHCHKRRHMRRHAQREQLNSSALCCNSHHATMLHYTNNSQAQTNARATIAIVMAIKLHQYRAGSVMLATLDIKNWWQKSVNSFASGQEWRGGCYRGVCRHKDVIYLRNHRAELAPGWKWWCCKRSDGRFMCPNFPSEANKPINVFKMLYRYIIF